MKSLIKTDYEIDLLFGEIACIIAIVFGLRGLWKMAFRQVAIVSMTWAIIYILIPALLLIFLNKHNLKYAKRYFWIWQACAALICLSLSNDVLDHFRTFWKVILPIAFVTICMMVGVNGLIRIKEPDKLKLPKVLKIPETHVNLLRLLDSLTYLIALILWFIFAVLIGKYFCDFVLLNWPSFAKQRVIVFYIGMTIGFYPAKILGAVISCIFTFLVNRIYKSCAVCSE